MSETYTDIGDAIYDFIGDLDLSAVLGVDEGWASSFNRPPKSNEILYPGYAVFPVRDQQETLDQITDDDAVTYAVYIFFHYWEATDTEGQIRAIVDIVRSALRSERINPTPLDNSCYIVGFAGEWGGDETQGERFYRLEVTCKIAEDL